MWRVSERELSLASVESMYNGPRGVFHQWLFCSVEEAGVDQLLEKEFDIPELRVLDAQRLEHAQVAVLNGQEHRPQVLEIVARQVEGVAEVLDGLGL